MSECPGGCCPHDSFVLSAGCPGDLPLAPPRERVAHLRLCQLLPVNKIVAATGSDRQTITRLLFEIAAEASPGGPARRMMRRAAEDDWLGQVMADTPQQARVAADAVLVRSVGDRAPRRAVRRPRGPSGARETRRPHCPFDRAGLAALPCTAGADRRPCERSVRGLRAWPDPDRPAHWQALRRRWCRSARKRYPTAACWRKVPVFAPVAPAPRVATVPLGLRAARDVRDDDVLAMRLAITAGIRRADGFYPPEVQGCTGRRHRDGGAAGTARQ